MSLSSDIGQRRLTLADKFRSIQWGLVILIAAISGIGFAMLYSAANGSLQPWASRQMTRFAIAFVPMLLVAIIDIRHWFRAADWVYGVALMLVIAVDLRGFVGMGAQRWIDLGFIQLQPSEIMTIGLVLALARYFHCVPSESIGRFSRLIPPVLLILIPAALVLKQPDLGTAVLLLASGAILCFLGGVRLRMFLLAAVGAGVAAPIAWRMLRDYQKTRLYTFLDPEQDPLGAGYHITQSRIALGSGGLFGKGFLNGTQSHLNFLPEKQTDFIFPLIAEEWGLWGGAALLGLFALMSYYGVVVGLRSRNQFGRMLAIGLSV